MKSCALILFSLLALAGAAVADTPKPPPAPPPPQEDPLGERLFPPELIMSHQRDIGLDDKTRSAMVDDIQQFQTAAVKLQWDMKAEGDALARMLDDARPDEAKVLAQADKVMGLEREMKRAHLGLLVRLKGKLTPAQQATLQKARRGR
ncbi:MAG: periplasmic heavy metal sensor [Deltaproteobacteria bacterium]|nr:MAG: periplasmic heavy metal sensor [Deltaproteobacteria bacterium]